jgi:hypothetical protein
LRLAEAAVRKSEHEDLVKIFESHGLSRAEAEAAATGRPGPRW